MNESKGGQMKKLKLADIVVKFYTRRQIDDDKVETFALLMEEGVVFPPIEVTPEEPPSLIDGRTRLEAYKLRDIEEIQCVICDTDTPWGYKARALKANYGGSQPNSKDDIARTIQGMLQDGATTKQIVDVLQFIPSRIVKKLIDLAGQSLRCQKVNQAKRDLHDGLTLEDIKKKYGKDGEWIVDKICEVKNATKDKRMGLLANQKAIDSKIKSLASARSKIFKDICKMYEEGIISAKDAFVLFTSWRDSDKRLARTVDDYIARFISLAHDDGLEYQPIKPSKNNGKQKQQQTAL